MEFPVIDLTLFRTIAYSAVVSDCCDRFGLRDQAFAPGLRPITPNMPVIVGWARPVRAVAVQVAPALPYEAEVTYIDALARDDVVVAVADPASAFWGELFSTAAMARGAAGAVIEGMVRDAVRITELGWPVLALDTHPTDSLGRLSIVESDVPVLIRGVRVARGDLVVADGDGTIVVPADAAGEIIARAIEKAQTESRARAMLEAGSYLREVWERFKVL